MRQEKQLLLDEIKDKVASAPAFVLTSYQGLNPNLGFDFRKTVYASGGSFWMVKKRLFLKAAQEVGLSVEKKALQSHLAVVSAGENDAAGIAKVVYGFAKDNKGVLEVLGGYFEGKICSPQEVEAISKLPSKQEMRSTFVGLLEAPMTQTLGTIEAILTSVLHCLEAKANKES